MARIDATHVSDLPLGSPAALAGPAKASRGKKPTYAEVRSQLDCVVPVRPALLLWVLVSMNKLENVPEAIRLDVETLYALTIAYKWLHIFPDALRQHARLNTDRLPLAMATGEISLYRLLSAAYIGVVPLPSTYGRFITQAERVSKWLRHNFEAFLDDDFKALLDDDEGRENSAAGCYGMSRGELKRMLARLDQMAVECAGAVSYDAIANCKDFILRDPSPFAPEDRNTYATGPLYLWDFAKAVNEDLANTSGKRTLGDMRFGTSRGWVLFAHVGDGVVLGHAIYPRAHLFGNFAREPVIDIKERIHDEERWLPIIEVPRNVEESVRELATLHFPGRPFKFVLPPATYMGMVFGPERVATIPRPYRTEV